MKYSIWFLTWTSVLGAHNCFYIMITRLKARSTPEILAVKFDLNQKGIINGDMNFLDISNLDLKVRLIIDKTYVILLPSF